MNNPLLLSNGEYQVNGWKCPSCQHIQNDSVHPIDGPWVSCICGECGKGFEDADLDERSRAAWDAARAAAEEHANG